MQLSKEGVKATVSNTKQTRLSPSVSPWPPPSLPSAEAINRLQKNKGQVGLN